MQIEHQIKKVEQNMDKNMENMARLIQNLEEKFPKCDVYPKVFMIIKFEWPSINKNIPWGFDFNSGKYCGWFPKGNHLPKIDMRKFDGTDPIPWIF